MIGNEKRKEMLFICFSAVICMITITVCSKNSFLYPMNDWVDVNCFYTMGKSIGEGKVIYRDVFDHKGPILHFIYYFLQMFASESYLGIYVLEIVAMSIYAYILIKCEQFFLKNDRLILVTVPVLVMLTICSKAFVHGGSVEEICLFMIAYPLYVFLKYILSGKEIMTRQWIVMGICLGVVFWIKYTMIGFFAGCYIYYLIDKIREKEMIKFLKANILFFVGFCIVSVPVMIYFIYHNALYDLWEGYFYYNIFLYTEKQSIFTKIYLGIRGLLSNAIKNIWYNLFGFAGIVYYMAKKNKLSLFLILTYIFMAIPIYAGGRNSIYYNLPFSIYSVFGIIVVLKYFENIKINSNILVAVMLSECIFVCVGSYMFGNYTYCMQYKKEDFPQYKFAEIISKKENATLLNYGFLDGGFYFAADIIPNNRYFYVPNLNVAKMEQEQKRYVEEENVDFIVTREKMLEEDFNKINYELIGKESFMYLGQTMNYYLYEKIK